MSRAFGATVARALVPAGFMPGSGGLILCPAYGPSAGVRHVAMNDDMVGMAHAGGGFGHDLAPGWSRILGAAANAPEPRPESR